MKHLEGGCTLKQPQVLICTMFMVTSLPFSFKYLPPPGNPHDSHQVFSILQWNCYHLNDLKYSELSSLVSQYNPSVIALNEVCAVGSIPKVPAISGYHKPMMLRPKNAKGIAIFVQKGLLWNKFHLHLKESAGAYAQAIDIFLNDRVLTVVNVYVNPSTKVSRRRSFWANLMECLDTKEHFCIVGDINDPCNILSASNQGTSKILEDLLVHHNLTVLNDG